MKNGSRPGAWLGADLAKVVLAASLVVLASCSDGGDGTGLLGAGTAPTLVPPLVQTPAAAEPSGKMSPGLRAAYIASVQENAGPEYDFESVAGRAVARTPSQGFTAELAEGALHVASDSEFASWSIELRWTGVGRGNDIKPVESPTGAPAVGGNRATYRRLDDSQEWYLNGPLGIEHGLTVASRPPGDDELVVELTAGGSVFPALSDDGREVLLADAEGNTVLRYSDLFAHDADGNSLNARLLAESDKIRLLVDDREAIYPVTIDPLLWVELTKLVGSDTSEADMFGGAVSLSSATALVGAHMDDDGGSEAGSAYVFARAAAVWSEQQKLTASDGEAGDQLGFSVGVDGDTVLVGAPRDSDGGLGRGSAYVFTRAGAVWEERQRLTASDGQANDELGWAVALSGGTALVGAPYSDDGGADSGAAYVFARNATVWSQQAKLTAGDGEAGDQFGYAVSVDGDTALVGARFDDDRGVHAGAAYAFVRSAGAWSQQRKFTAPDGAADDELGASVSLDGEFALVAAPLDDNLGGQDAGGVYTFSRSASVWSDRMKLLAGDAAPNDSFGCSVGLSADTALVGAWARDGVGFNSGSAYVFERVGQVWTQREILTASDAAGDDELGHAVALSADTALVGSPRDDDGGDGSGSAYIHGLRKTDGEPCSQAYECVSKHCVDDVCCDLACGDGALDDCEACSIAAGASSDGVCAGLSETSCDDGLFCNGSDTCAAGSCTTHAGSPCAGADGDDDCRESCDEETDGCTANDPDGSSCAGAGMCTGGACQLPGGAPCSGDGDCQTGICTDDVCCAETTCAPFVCGPAGSCLVGCTSNADCQRDYVCSSDGKCVEASAQDSADDGGCSCRLESSEPPAPRWAALGLVGLAFALARRRRTGRGGRGSRCPSRSPSPRSTPTWS